MTEQQPESKLSQADLDRVNRYLNSPMHQVERKPFRPLYFVILTVGSVSFLSFLAFVVTKLSGVELS